MTGPDSPPPKEPADAPPSPDELVDPPADDPIAALVKRALSGGDPAEPSILPSVQRRIRKRSRGKFFADGWSTTDARVSHIVIALAMLLVILIAYFALGPVGIQ